MIEANKFCFIYSVNDDAQAFESVQALNLLEIPLGFSIELRIIKNSNCLTAAYNRGMYSSKAKFKIYLHQDVKIINPNFLMDLLGLFTKHPRLGLLGMAGAKKLNTNGIWWSSDSCFGKVLWEESLHFWNDVASEYEPAQAVDGLAMITQYDLRWREDLFKKWHFYDISQSLEFIKAGYEVGIPRQVSPWCQHKYHEVNMQDYEEERQTFLREYRAFLK